LETNDSSINKQGSDEGKDFSRRMRTMSDAELVLLYQDVQVESMRGWIQDELIRRYKPMLEAKADIFQKQYRLNDDYLGVAVRGAVRGFATYESSKGSLRTWVTWNVVGMMHDVKDKSGLFKVRNDERKIRSLLSGKYDGNPVLKRQIEIEIGWRTEEEVAKGAARYANIGGPLLGSSLVTEGYDEFDFDIIVDEGSDSFQNAIAARDEFEQYKGVLTSQRHKQILDAILTHKVWSNKDLEKVLGWSPNEVRAAKTGMITALKKASDKNVISAPI
jgi:DNA-directed RNA polymerase specialized sigma subunit